VSVSIPVSDPPPVVRRRRRGDADELIPARTDRRELLLRIAIVVVAAAPALAATLSVIGVHWVPGGDQAIEVLRISDVGGPYTPMVGPWSRWGWAHPGPALFWLLAPTQHLFGNDGVLLACGLLSTASAAGIAAVAIRRGGTVLGAITALGVVGFLGGMGLSTAVDPWNPYVALLPFLLFVLLVWSVVCDDLVMAPVAAVVGSFCVQAHVGFLPLVGGLSALAFVAVAVRHLRAHRAAPEGGMGDPGEPAVVDASGVDTPDTDTPDTDTPDTDGSRSDTGSGGLLAAVRRHRLLSTFLATVVAGGLMWLAPLWDQLFGSGNLSALLSYARSPESDTAGWSKAFGIMSGQLRLPAPWMGANEASAAGLTLTAGWAWGVGAVLLLVVATVVAVRRRHVDVAILDGIAVAAIGLAVLSTARMTGFVAPYMTQWWWIVSFVALLALVWTVVSLLDLADARALAVGALGVAVVVGGFVVVRDVPVDPPVPTLSRALSELVGPTAAALDRDGRYVVHTVDERNWGGAGPGLQLALEQLGYHVFVGPTDLTDIQYGARRVLEPAAGDGVITIVGLDSMGNGWVPPDGVRELARYDPLSPAERREFDESQASMHERMSAALGSEAPEGVLSMDSLHHAMLARASGVSQAEIDRMKELQAPGSGFAVFLSPPA